MTANPEPPPRVSTRPVVVTEAPHDVPQVRLGVQDILGRLSSGATERATQASVSNEERGHLQTVARLAAELQQALTDLERLQPPDQPS